MNLNRASYDRARNLIEIGIRLHLVVHKRILWHLCAFLFVTL